MTIFTDVKTIAALTKEIGTEHIIERLVSYLESDFLRWAEFDKSPRLANHSELGVIELMPISDANQYAFKYVNGHPDNGQKNLSTVMAFGVLANVDTGYPVLLSELTLTTALRTAATSVMVAKKLARKNSTTMALIGNGCQSEFQAIAFHHLLGITKIKCFDVDSKASEKLVRNLSLYPDLEVIICSSAKEATVDADIITTVTADKKRATIVTPDMIADGVHINGVGGDCPGKTEIDAKVLIKGSIFVEYAPQSRIEGDIQQLPEDHPVTEFWQVIANEHPGRESDKEITIFDSVGFALEDYSALRLLNDLIVEHKIGETIELVPDLVDQKNLFALLN
jgi:ornithine cyclodeaminase